ncbi:MAG: hypothetical protein QT00_C0002G0408 [archaeon GW2011_AR5]|nr:MAG: hypothetical protein QT00_C0002G0408 [archaeon GW2011_AR5]
MQKYRVRDDTGENPRSDVVWAANIVSDTLEALGYSVKHRQDSTTFSTDSPVSKRHKDSVRFIIEPYRISKS